MNQLEIANQFWLRICNTNPEVLKKLELDCSILFDSSEAFSIQWKVGRVLEIERLKRVYTFYLHISNFSKSPGNFKFDSFIQAIFKKTTEFDLQKVFSFLSEIQNFTDADVSIETGNPYFLQPSEVVYSFKIIVPIDDTDNEAIEMKKKWIIQNQSKEE